MKILRRKFSGDFVSFYGSYGKIFIAVYAVGTFVCVIIFFVGTCGAIWAR